MVLLQLMLCVEAAEAATLVLPWALAARAAVTSTTRARPIAFFI